MNKRGGWNFSFNTWEIEGIVEKEKQFKQISSFIREFRVKVAKSQKIFSCSLDLQRNKLRQNSLFLAIQILYFVFKIQVNLCQKHLFLHQLTHYMTTDCSLNYKFSTWKLQGQNMLCAHIVFVLTFRTICVHNMFWACNFHVLNS